MASAARKVAEIAKARKAPDFKGVAGELVAIPEGVALTFARGQKKISPYDALLDQLAASPGQLLRFEDRRARGSVGARAKKKGLRVSFAEAGALLYVRLDGRVDDDVRASRREHILKALKVGPRNAINLAVALREGGDATIDAPLVAAILTQMSRDGQVIAQEGGMYRLDPKAKH